MVWRFGTISALPGCRFVKEVEMKTGQDVRELGLYASDCCLEEMLFDANDSFSRCPHCSRLCEWELVDAVVPWQDIAKLNDSGYEAA